MYYGGVLIEVSQQGEIMGTPTCYQFGTLAECRNPNECKRKECGMEHSSTLSSGEAPRHTLGPWSAKKLDIYSDDYDRAIARTFDFGGMEDGIAEANARRIVACVNALEGVDNDLLESGTELIRAQAKEIDRLSALNGELVARLKAIDEAWYYGQAMQESIDLARAILAKCHD